MEDGRNSSISISSTSGQQQDLVADAFGPGGGTGGGGAAAGWGTLEELLLIGAISRHGSGDWAVVAGELQGRARLLSMPPAYFSPEACKNKFDGLSGRYGSVGYRSSGGGGGRDKEPENHPAWFEDIRRRRVAQLKRELERHDGCIVSLSNKLKRLKAERAQSLQTANKQQQQVAAAAAGKSFHDDSSALAVAAESQKPLDSSESFKAEDEGIPKKPSSPSLDPAASAHETPSLEPPPATSEEEPEDVGLPPPASSVAAVVGAGPQELLIDEKDLSTAAADAPETDDVEPPAEAEPVVVETDRSIDEDEIGVGIGEKAVESTEGEGITPDSETEKLVIHHAEPAAGAETLAAVVSDEAEEAKSVDAVDDDSAVVVVDSVCTSEEVVNTAEATESSGSKPAVESEQRDDAALNTEDVVEEAAMEDMENAKEGNLDMDSKDEELDKLDEIPEHPGAQVETEEKKLQEVDTKAEELHDEADAIKSVATKDENEVVNADVDMLCLKNEAADLRTEGDDKSDDLQTAAGKDEGSLQSKVELKSSEEAAEMETDEAVETAEVDTSRKDEDAMDVDEAPVVAEVVAAALAETVESPEPSQEKGLDMEPVPVVVQATEAERGQPVDEDVKNMEPEDAVELHPETTNSGVVDSLETQTEAEASVVDEPMDPEKALTPAAAGGNELANVAPSVPAAELEAVQEKKTGDSDFVEPASEAAAAAAAASELTEAAADGPHQSESAVVLSEVVDPSTVSIEERPLPGDAGEAEEALDLSSKDVTPLAPAEEDAGAMATTDSEPEKMLEDVGVKLVGEGGGQLVVDIIGEPLEEPIEPSRPAEAANPAEEKEASSSAVQSSSSEGTTKQFAYKEKSDESQGGGARQADSVEKPETIVCKASRQDVGSPASANEDFQEEKDEGSGSAQEQSKDEEKSEVGGSQVDGPEDTSPTSRRLKKESKLPGKLQPLLECLRTICAHKFAPLFKQRQESQDDPRYDQVIRRHVDLNMIRARLEEGGYSGSLEFFRDLLLVFNNSIVFYPRESQEYNASVALRKLTLEEMDRILQAEVLMKQDRPATRKRDSKRPVESVPVSVPIPAPVPAARAGVSGSSSGKRQVELSTSDNSKSKSASLSLSLGVPSSRGGEEEDAREGEPEVEGKSTAKPLKAYGRKNRGDAAQQEARRAAAAAGKGVARERPKESLEAIVKKIGKAEEAAAAALAKETAAAAAAAAAKETPSKAAAAKETPAAAAKAKDAAAAKAKDAAAAEASKASSKAPPAGRQAAAGEGPAAPTTSAVRGARNKRSSAKEATQRSASAGKRTRRI